MNANLGNISLFFDLLYLGSLSNIYLFCALVPVIAYGITVRVLGQDNYRFVALYALIPFLCIQVLTFSLINENAIRSSSTSAIGKDFNTKGKLEENNLQVGVVSDICFLSDENEHHATFKCNPEINKAIYQKSP